MQTNELLKINSEEFWITDEKVNDLIKPFIPQVQKYMEFIPQIEALKKVENITPEIVAKAKRLRLDIKPIRTQAEKIKTTEKSSYLTAGNVIQKWYNMLLWIISEQEEALEKIEKHFENLEKERIAKLQIERVKLLKPYEVENSENLKLWEMEDVVFENFLEGSKKAYLDKKQAEADEKKRKEYEELENKRLKEENDRLKKEADDAKKIADDLEKEKKQKEDLIAKNQAENEILKNDQEYQNFIAIHKWLFDKILKEDWKVVLYRKVAEFITINKN